MYPKVGKSPDSEVLKITHKALNSYILSILGLNHYFNQ
jgi:hypothetical protein